MRYYAEAMLSKRGNKLLEFNTTAFSLFGGLSLITLAIWLMLATFVLPNFIEHQHKVNYFWIVSIFIVLRMMGSVTKKLAGQFFGSVKDKVENK